MKLDPTKEDYDQEWGWVGSPRCEGATEDEKFVIENRYDLEIIGGITDDDASYSYDDWALAKLGLRYFLLSTSGCSCPSPSETWRVEIGPTTLKKIRKHILSGNYEGYTMPKRQMNDFIELLDKAEAADKE